MNENRKKDVVQLVSFQERFFLLFLDSIAGKVDTGRINIREEKREAERERRE